MAADQSVTFDAMRVMALTLLVLAVMPAVAGAAIPPGALGVARAAWPGSPCAGREQVSEVPIVLGEPSYAGAAFVAGCRVEVRVDLPPATACTTLVHEFGHLAGYGHPDTGPTPSDYRAAVMVPVPSLWPSCAALGAPYVLAKDHAVGALRRALPRQRRIVGCRRSAVNEWQCVTRRFGATARRYAVTAQGGRRLSVVRLDA